jgi:hypothetical protein
VKVELSSVCVNSRVVANVFDFVTTSDACGMDSVRSMFHGNQTNTLLDQKLFQCGQCSTSEVVEARVL